MSAVTFVEWTNKKTNIKYFFSKINLESYIIPKIDVDAFYKINEFELKQHFGLTKNDKLDPTIHLYESWAAEQSAEDLRIASNVFTESYAKKNGYIPNSYEEEFFAYTVYNSETKRWITIFKSDEFDEVEYVVDFSSRIDLDRAYEESEQDYFSKPGHHAFLCELETNTTPHKYLIYEYSGNAVNDHISFIGTAEGVLAYIKGTEGPHQKNPKYIDEIENAMFQTKICW